MLKAKLLDFGKKHHSFMLLMRKSRIVLVRVRYLYYALRYRIQDKQIFFEVFNGRKYVDSPKYLYLTLLNDPQYRDYHFIWAFNDRERYAFLAENARTTVVQSKSKAYYKALASSKYWILNYRFGNKAFKKHSQIFLQCWHGTPLKKLGCDIEVDGNQMNTIADIHQQYRFDAKRYDYFLSPSAFASEAFTSAFALKDKSILLECGYPRNDILKTADEALIKQLKAQLKLPIDKQIILYAPTFREDSHISGFGYTYDLNLDFQRFKERFAAQYIVLFRAHYLVANAFDFAKYGNFVYDFSDYDDINDLYLISDLLITDYSSVFFDYADLKRPIIFYMYDYERYKNKLRDFYLDLQELPGEIVETEEALFAAIEHTKQFQYDEKYRKFNRKYNYLDDGKAAERVVKALFK